MQPLELGLLHRLLVTPSVALVEIEELSFLHQLLCQQADDLCVDVVLVDFEVLRVLLRDLECATLGIAIICTLSLELLSKVLGHA